MLRISEKIPAGSETGSVSRASQFSDPDEPTHEPGDELQQHHLHLELLGETLQLLEQLLRKFLLKKMETKLSNKSNNNIGSKHLENASMLAYIGTVQ
jgi:hypothetical protein